MSNENIKRQLEYMQRLPKLLFSKMEKGDEKKFLIIFGDHILARYDTAEEASNASLNGFKNLNVGIANGEAISLIFNPKSHTNNLYFNFVICFIIFTDLFV